MQELFESLKSVKERTPLVQAITNYAVEKPKGKLPGSFTTKKIHPQFLRS